MMSRQELISGLPWSSSSIGNQNQQVGREHGELAVDVVKADALEIIVDLFRQQIHKALLFQEVLLKWLVIKSC